MRLSSIPASESYTIGGNSDSPRKNYSPTDGSWLQKQNNDNGAVRTAASVPSEPFTFETNGGSIRKNYSPTGGSWLKQQQQHNNDDIPTTAPSSYLDWIGNDGADSFNSDDESENYEQHHAFQAVAGQPASATPSSFVSSNPEVEHPSNEIKNDGRASSDSYSYGEPEPVNNDAVQLPPGSFGFQIPSRPVPKENASSDTTTRGATKFSTKSNYLYSPNKKKPDDHHHQLASYVDNLGGAETSTEYITELREPVQTDASHDYDNGDHDTMSSSQVFIEGNSEDTKTETIEYASEADTSVGDALNMQVLSTSPMFEYLKFEGTAPTFDVLAKTKAFVESVHFGVSANEEIFDTNYVLRGPVIGPINRADLQALHGSQQGYAIQEAFPSIQINSFGYSIDPENPYRCFYFQRWRAVHENPLQFNDACYPATGVEAELPVTVCSVVWTPKGKIIYEQIGAVVDRLEGNTQGKTDVFGLLHAAGAKNVKAKPGDKWFAFQQRLSHFVGGSGRGRSWSTPKNIPEWWQGKSRGADESDQW